MTWKAKPEGKARKYTYVIRNTAGNHQWPPLNELGQPRVVYTMKRDCTAAFVKHHGGDEAREEWRLWYKAGYRCKVAQLPLDMKEE